ncbi:MAG TPA: DEAD/DEAH box helicase [Acidimicrobiales bacterium]|nr:DEAD/DEAH box helicase [Acidimicrobiales bacterium]
MSALRPTPVTDGVLASFHPAVRAWFSERFPGGPTAPQSAAWPLIADGGDVLVASPTGTGKTLTGFLVAIDAAYRAHDAGGERRGLPTVLYVSPLRALATDVHENLGIPLVGIREAAEQLGLDHPALRVAVRTGDTPPAERTAMTRTPPDLLVTTPESLYLLLTAASSRAMLRGVRTVIIDEVHTLARDKRGSHLALSLERLAHVVAADGGRLQRIGLSATQRPLETVARLLTGTAADRPPTSIVDCGHRRDLDVDLELPDAELEAVAPHGQFGEVLDRIAGHVRDHRTTLVFVNTRKLAERVAHQLGERLGEEGDGQLLVAAHHGSLSAERRRLVEARLRAGELKALVATASLELGIDVGPVELVCQIGSPRAIGTFLQRVGRANHQLEGTPAGRLYPLTRDELVECTALLSAVRSGRLDRLVPPVAPLDVLAQQVVAEVAAAEEWDEDELFALVRRSAPFADLERSRFDDVVELVSSGIATGRGRRGAHLHRDGVNRRLRPRRGARLAALTSGGAIPETGDYRVVLDPDGVTIGSLHEDFSIEANIGDVFLLGTHSWRVKKVEVGTVRVVDAGDAAPTVPFWLGEAPARTTELSEEVGSLREALEPHLAAGDAPAARRQVVERAGVSEDVADQVVAYLAAGRAALGALPTRRRLVIERFFDESEGMQLVVHAPYGGRVNRALGLALRKRFCVSFDFELQAAADDDTVVLSLGPQHSFPLSQVPRMLSSRTATEVLVQAVLTHPMLAARWRWNCTRALVVPRSRSGQRRPINLQRMDADDLMAATWPALAACQENAAPGPVVVPDHVLVTQTVDDCLHEALDVDGLVDLLADIESGAVDVHVVEAAEPSPLAHGILTGRPYTFLDGAPLEERRTRAVPLPRGLGVAGADGLPVPADELGPLDPGAATEVLDQVRPRPRDRHELHDLLLSLVSARPVAEWSEWFDELAAEGRASVVDGCWVATERRTAAEQIAADDESAAECVRGHLDLAGPVSVAALVGDGPLPAGAPRGAPLGERRAATGLARLEAQGAAIQLPDGRWCSRHLLVRLHAASRNRRRRFVEPVSIAVFMRFLLRFQHVAEADRLEGRAGLLAVVEQLAGLEIPAGDWESRVLPARVAGYQPQWLDELCLSGEVAWGRLTARAPRSDAAGPGSRRGAATPSPATPLALVVREDLGWQLMAVRHGERPEDPAVGASADVLEVLARRGACFRSELASATGRLPVEVDEGLWDLVTRGLVTADAFSAVRSLLSARDRWRARQRPRSVTGVGLARRRAQSGTGVGEGRWSLLPADEAPEGRVAAEDLAEAVAGQLLARWGVVAWELWSRESFSVPWRDVVRALRRLEARGLASGGRFVAGLAGEQYAAPDALALLAEVRRSPGRGEQVAVAGSDPLNVTGTVLPGPRVPAQRRRRVVYLDGLPVADPAAG